MSTRMSRYTRVNVTVIVSAAFLDQLLLPCGSHVQDGKLDFERGSAASRSIGH